MGSFGCILQVEIQAVDICVIENLDRGYNGKSMVIMSDSHNGQAYNGAVPATEYGILAWGAASSSVDLVMPTCSPCYSTVSLIGVVLPL